MRTGPGIRPRWREVQHAKSVPTIGFRNDVVAVDRKGETSISDVAKGFGASKSSLQRWLTLHDIEASKRPGLPSDESAERRELMNQAPISTCSCCHR